MLELNQNNKYRGMLDSLELEDSFHPFKRKYRYEVGYEVGFNNYDLIGQLCHFNYGHHNYYGKIIKQYPFEQTIIIEACTYDELKEQLNKQFEEFDYVI